MSSRYAATILIETSGRQLAVGFDDGEQETCRAVIVAPHVARSLVVPADGRLVSLNLDPHSYEFHILVHALRGRRSLQLNDQIFGSLQDKFDALFDGHLLCCDCFRLFNDVVRQLFGNERPEAIRIDLRVLHVARRLQAELPNPPSVVELAESVGLSTDRLGHLFADQLGLTIKSYLLWAKTRRVASLFNTGVSLTDMAHAAGFADSAHLSRTFRQFFGLAPSFLSDNRHVHYHSCDS